MTNTKGAEFTTAQNNNDSSNSNSTNTSISLNNDVGHQGIITVMFDMNKSIYDWVANTWWDGKIIIDDDGKIEMIPNSDYYKCPICEILKSIKIYNYKECSGTHIKPHELIATIPQNWYPLLSRTGISAVIGDLEMSINSNIQTANLTKNSNDIMAKSDLDSRLVNLATHMAIASVGALLCDTSNYAPWLLEDPELKQLPIKFSLPFLEKAMTTLAHNYLASYTKGKGMEAIDKILTNKSVIEQQITNKSERALTEQTTSSSTNGLWSGLFGLNKK